MVSQLQETLVLLPVNTKSYHIKSKHSFQFREASLKPLRQIKECLTAPATYKDCILCCYKGCRAPPPLSVFSEPEYYSLFYGTVGTFFQSTIFMVGLLGRGIVRIILYIILLIKGTMSRDFLPPFLLKRLPGLHMNS